jgi:imidazolonepropionase-like amidohydrolase
LPEGEERDLWIVGDRLTYEPISGAHTISTTGWAIPGLVDAHCHIGLGPGGPVSHVAEARELAIQNRDAGILTIRDAGSPIDYAELDDDVELPRLLRAGRHIAAPRRYLRGLAIECAPEQLAAEAAGQARAGNGWVKIVGDWIDRSLGDLAPAYDDGTIAAAVTAAHAAGARVAVHTFSEAALPGLIAAGVDSIEHGTGLSPELVGQMAEKGIALVPTLTNIANFPHYAAQGEPKFPRYANHMRSLHAGFPAVIAAAYDAGVPIYAGTDAGTVVAHAQLPSEIGRLHAAGMSAADALAAGSWRAREWLGLTGLVEDGLADVVVYPRDPRVDLGVLAEPSRIVLRGRLIR